MNQEQWGGYWRGVKVGGGGEGVVGGSRRETALLFRDTGTETKGLR